LYNGDPWRNSAYSCPVNYYFYTSNGHSLESVNYACDPQSIVVRVGDYNVLVRGTSLEDSPLHSFSAHVNQSSTVVISTLELNLYYGQLLIITSQYFNTSSGNLL
jgi:hypothetical protein